ncbi:MAG TPA: lysine biosynthesis protein LysX [Desulfobacteraceae bacterium]|jgi:[lysine-biosynthesis-protein LysW]--L-2-aminoadipate ligase|nr:lysine biosynthesis protein LysX [Desulfobacteraceae bacterium]HPJ68302.1 lysine biosynthesis protein LysX [Desulfobacteraceae bacterium]HPQ29665.1 lysine biosynthesis protein LysX [Desulfobacteraceae bacterium]
MKVGFLHSILRKEEKYLLDEFRKRPDVELIKIDDREQVFFLNQNNFDYDVVIERCVNHSRAVHALKIYSDNGIPTVNTPEVAEICGSKFLTTQALIKEGIPTPRCYLAFTPEAALEAMEKLGYPCVIKPTTGSWGRLISKVNDQDSAEAILEHKAILGSYHHSIFYIQEYIEKKNGDIRSFVVGNECIAAIYRLSEHWITNTARGAKTINCPVTDELNDISVRAAKSVGGGVVAIDLFETDNGLSVNEVNYTMEFRNSIDVTGVNIPAKIVDYVLEAGRK